LTVVAGEVIPGLTLESVGLFDMDGLDDVPDKHRLLHDLLQPDSVDGTPSEDEHSDGQGHIREHPYGVRPGSFLNEYDARTYRRAYPHLFPYGRGAPESVKGVGLTQYFRWAMRCADGRFRHDKHFYFDLFGVQQKREVSRTAKVVFKRQDWARVSAAMSSVVQEDVEQAMREEQQQQPVSNRAISDFIRSATLTRATVVGSDTSRYRFRSQIWGTSVMLGNPSLFLTINLADHHDPIAQFLLGEDIDLDHFMNELGPSAIERSRNISADPFVAAQYFNTVVSAILEHLIGVSVSQNRVRSKVRLVSLLPLPQKEAHFDESCWPNRPKSALMSSDDQKLNFDNRICTFDIGLTSIIVNGLNSKDL
jgi:Helitron helicase-like domain at N-terminus